MILFIPIEERISSLTFPCLTKIDTRDLNILSSKFEIQLVIIKNICIATFQILQKAISTYINENVRLNAIYPKLLLQILIKQQFYGDSFLQQSIWLSHPQEWLALWQWWALHSPGLSPAPAQRSHGRNHCHTLHGWWQFLSTDPWKYKITCMNM